MIPRPILLIVGLMIVAASPVSADEIRLKNGSILQGRIVREDKDVIVIDLGRGRMSIQRRDVIAIKKDPTPPPAEEPTGPTRDQRGRPSPENPEDAVPAPQRNPNPRVVPAQVPRKKKPVTGAGPNPDAGMSPKSPKVVPVERPPQPPPAKEPAKTANETTGKKPASRPTAKPDW